MYKNFFLSLLGLALVGKAFATEVTLPTCNKIKGAPFTPADCIFTAVTPINYCIDSSSNKIYEVLSQGDGTISCNKKPLEAGLYVFQVEEAKLCIPLTNEPNDWGSSCTNYFTGDNCANQVSLSTGQTCNDIPFNNDGTYKKKLTEVKFINMSATPTPTIASEDEEKIVLYNCDGTQCKQTSGYIKDSIKIFTVQETGGADDTGTTNKVTACNKDSNGGDADSTGNLNVGAGTEFKLCITESSEVEANGNIYRMEEKAENIFTGDTTHGFITIKTQTNIFAWDNISEGLDLKPCSEYSINSEPASASCTSTDPHVNFCVIGLKIYSLDKSNNCRSAFQPTNKYLELTDKLNAVRLDGTSRIDIDTESNDIADIQNYILVDCVSTGTPPVYVCKQTQGYIKINSNSDVNAFVGTKSGSSSDGFVSTNDGTEGHPFVQEDIGKVSNNVGNIEIFIKLGKKVTIDDGTDYLISEAATGPFEDSDGVPLKITAKYVIKNMFTSGVKLVDTNGVYYELGSGSLLNYILYDCKDGKCIETQGYVKNNDEVYAFKDEGGGVKADEEAVKNDFYSVSPISNCDTVHLNGYIFNDKTKICIGSIEVAFDVNERYLIKYEQGDPTTTPFYVENENVPVKVVKVNNDVQYIVVDKFNSVNLVKSADSTLLTDFSTINLSINYVLVDCVRGICKQTQGYVKDSNENVIAFVGEDNGINADDNNNKVQFYSSTSIVNCDNINKIGYIKDGKGSICLNKNLEVPFLDDNKRFLIFYDDEIPETTPFYVKNENVPIKHGANYIIIDKFNSGKGVNLYKTTDGSFITDFNVNINVNEGYILIDCVDSICKQTQGYVKDSEKVIAFVGEDNGIDASDNVAFYSSETITNCNNIDKIGYINGVNGNICLNEESKEVSFSNENKSFLIFYDNKIPKTTPFYVENENVSVKQGEHYIIVDKFNSVNLFNKADYSIVNKATDFDAANEELNADNGVQYYIYDCEDGKCRQTSGYIKSVDDVIAFIGEGSGGHAVPAIVESEGSCTSNKIGQVTKSKDGICYDASNKILFESDVPRYILLKGKAVEGTPFNDNVNSVVIKRGAEYIVRDKFYTELNMVNDDGSIETDFTKSIDLRTYVIVDCKEGVCRQTTGYVKNSNGVYAFAGESEGTLVNKEAKFIGEPAITNANGCASGYYGCLYNTNSGICIYNEKGITFANDANKYMILKGKGYAEGNPFEEAAEINIRIMRSAYYILKDNFYTSVTLVNKVDGTFTTDFTTPITGLAATPSDYVVVDCNDGNCIQTQGYVKNGGEVYAFKDEGGGVKADEEAVNYDFYSGTAITYCNDINRIGYIKGDKDSICLNEELTEVSFSGENKRFLIFYDDDIPKTTPFYVENENVPVKQGEGYIIIDKFNSVNLLDISNGNNQEIINDFVSTAEGLIPDNYKLYDCMDGICRQSSGYVVNNGEVIGFIGNDAGKDKSYLDEAGVNADVTQASECIKDHVGKYYTDAVFGTSVCITVGCSINMERPGNYMIMAGAAIAGTPFVEDEYEVPVKGGKGYVVRDKFNSNVNIVKVEDRTSTNDLEAANAKLNLNPSDYIIVDCVGGTDNRILCTQTSGYIINDKKIYSFGIDGGEEVTLSTKTEGTCTTAEIGKFILEDVVNPKFCIGSVNDDISIELKEPTDSSNPPKEMIVKGRMAPGTPFGDSTNIVKQGKNYVVVDKYFAFSNIVYYVNVDDGSFEDVSTADITGDNVDVSVIVQCSAEKKECVQTSGYLKDGTDVFAFVGDALGASASDAVDVDLTSKEGCSGKVGIVFGNANSICVKSNGIMSFVASTDEFMIMKGEGAEGTPFKNDDFDVVLMSGSNYIIKDLYYSEVCVTDLKDNKVTSAFEEMSATTNYKLFDCKNGNCRQTQGYVMKDKNNVYAFVDMNIGETIFGKSTYLGNPVISVNENSQLDAIKQCDKSYYGKVYAYYMSDPSSIYGICIDDEYGIDMGENPQDKFLMLKGTAAAGTPFVDEINNIVIKRGMGYIARDQFLSTVNLFNKDIYSIVDTATDFDKANEKLKANNEARKKYYIYDCEDGKCRQTSGYIKSVDDVIAFIGEGSGGHAAPAQTQTSNGDCSNDEIGKVKYDENGICYAEEKPISFANLKTRYIMLKGKAVDRTPFNDNVNSVVMKRGAAYIVRDKFYTALNMVNEDGTIETDFTKPIDLSTYVIVDCKEGVCRQTTGYVRNNNGVYAFAGESGALVHDEQAYIGQPAIADADSCTIGYYGSLYGTNTNSGICINDNKGIAFGDGDDNGYMILKGKTYVSGNPFEEAAKINIRIMRSGNYILKDNFYTSVTLVNKVDGTYTTDFATKNEGLVEIPSDYAVVDCKDGKCVQTQGYVVNNGNAFVFKDGEDGVIARKKLKVSSCSADQVGKLLSDLSGVCIGNGSSVMTFADGAEYIVMKGTAFDEFADILPLKSTANYIIRDYFYSNTNMVNKVDGTVTTDFSTTISGLATTPSNFVMVECLDGRCKQTQGYVKNGNTVYAFVGEDGGKSTENVKEFVGVSPIVEDSCGGSNGGMLIKDKKGICYPVTGKTIKFEDSEDIHIMMKGAAAAKTPFEDEDNGISIKQSAYYILKDAFYTEVNIFDPITGKVKTDLRNVDTDIESYKRLIDCVDGICKETSGYVVGMGKIFIYNGKNDGHNDSTDNETVDCNLGAVGKYINSGTGVCIENAMGAVNLSDKTKNIKHLIKTAAESGTPFNGATLNVLLKHGADYFVIDKFESVNLYDSSKQEVYSDFDIIDLSTPGTYNVLDCVDGVCKLTSGYIKSGSNIYKFINDGVGGDGISLVAASVTQASGCINDHVGKHFTDVKGRTSVCITVGHSINMERPGNYMIMAGAAVTDTPFKEVGSGVPVKGGKGYVVRDKFNSNLNIVKAKDGTSTVDLETANKALLANPSDYIIVYCIYNNGIICLQTSGYIINNDNVYSFVGTNGGREVTSVTVTSIDGTAGCSSQQVGKFVRSKEAMCYSNGNGIILNNNTGSKMIMEGMMSEGSPFAEETSLIKHGKNYIIKDKFGPGDGVFVVNVLNGAFEGLEVLRNGNVGNYKLVQCKSRKCTQTNGYVKVTVYTRRRDGGDGSNVKRSDDFDYYFVFIGNEVGKPVDSSGIGISFGNGNEIILKINHSNDAVFKDLENNVVVEKSEDYAIINKYFDDGVYLVNTSDGTIKTEYDFSSPIPISSLGNYVLVYCVDSICKETEGYVKINDEVYAYHGEVRGVKVNDNNKYSFDTEYCTKSNIGKLYSINAGVCLEETVSVAMNNDAEDKNYIIDGAEESVKVTPFKNDSHVVLKVTGKYIIKNVFYNSGEYCTYTDIAKSEVKKTKICKRNVLGELGEYYICENGICTEKTDGSNEVENGIYILTVNGKEKMFKCAKGHCWAEEYNGMFVVETRDNIEKVVLDDVKLDAIDGILDKEITLNECLKGVCNPTEGYIRYGVGNYIAEITNDGTSTVTDYVNCNDGDEGELLNNMDLCIDGSGGVTRAITGVGALTDTLLYQRTGANVVGAARNGYYVYNDDNKNKILKCVNYECNIIGDTFEGYVLNADYNTNDEKPLIYCTANDDCSIQPKEANGYYLYKQDGDNGFSYVQCDDDRCISLIPLDNNDCSNHGYGIIYTSGSEYKFCASATATPEDISTRYEVISGMFEPGKKFNYPADIYGSVYREILMKMTDYSVTALTGDAIPIGYIKVGSRYLECLYDEEGQKMCKEADVSGTECTVAGKLYTSNESVHLCVKPDVTPENIISVDNFNTAAEYVLPLGDGLFGIKKRVNANYFISIKIGDGNIIVNKEPTIVRFKYTDRDDTTNTTLYEVYRKDDAVTASETGEICSVPESKPFEFKLEQWTLASDGNKNIDYYVEETN